jgi:hypothetical protein
MPPPFCGIERHAGRRCQAQRSRASTAREQ